MFAFDAGELPHRDIRGIVVTEPGDEPGVFNVGFTFSEVSYDYGPDGTSDVGDGTLMSVTRLTARVSGKEIAWTRSHVNGDMSNARVNLYLDFIRKLFPPGFEHSLVGEQQTPGGGGEEGPGAPSSGSGGEVGGMPFKAGAPQAFSAKGGREGNGAADPVAGDRFVASDPPRVPAVDEGAALAHQAGRLGGADDTAVAAAIATIAAAPDAVEFGRRYLALSDEVFEIVRARLAAGDDLTGLERYLLDALRGLFEPLSAIFLERFRDDHSVEVSSIRHDIIGGLKQTMMWVASVGADDIKSVLDMILSPVEGDDLFAELFRAIRYSRAFAEAIEVKLAFDLPRDLRLREGFDGALVGQAFAELLWNAVKYHDYREAKSFSYVKPDRFVRILWDAQRAAFIVEDNGSGVRDPTRIFEEGYREADRYDKERRGTGMGLANIKRHFDSIGWTIEVESTVDVGTRFIVTPKAGDIIEGTHPSAGPSGSPASGGGGADPGTGTPPSAVGSSSAGATSAAGMPFGGLVVATELPAAGDDQVPAADDADDAAVPGALILTGAQPNAVPDILFVAPSAVIPVK